MNTRYNNTLCSTHITNNNVVNQGSPSNCALYRTVTRHSFFLTSASPMQALFVFFHIETMKKKEDPTWRESSGWLFN